MSYFTLSQNYINGKYTRPPNWADPCDKCGPFPYLPCPQPVCAPCGIAPAQCGIAPAPCAPCPTVGCDGPVPCNGSELNTKCKCKNKKKCKCKNKKKCINVNYPEPGNPCNTCTFQIAPCYEPPCPPPPPPPCDPCMQPWLQYWPWSIRSWGNCYY